MMVRRHNHSKSAALAFAIFSCACLLLVLIFAPAGCQNAYGQTESSFKTGSGSAPDSVNSARPEPQEEDGNKAVPESQLFGPDSIRYYAMLEQNGPLPPKVKQFIDQHPYWHKELVSNPGLRPAFQWYFWANRPKPFFRSFLFILFFALILWSLFPGWLKAAQSQCRDKFWTTFLVGALVANVLVWMVKTSISTLVGWPMGIMLDGMLELAAMAGLSIVVSLLGQSIGFYLKLERWPLIGARGDIRRFAQLFLGVLLCALLLQIPGFGDLPRIGPRLVGLLALLGLGGIYRARP